MPTSHDCEDEECVDGSAISHATVYMLPDLLHRLELSVVHMYSYLYLFQRSLQYRSVHMEPECP